MLRSVPGWMIALGLAAGLPAAALAQDTTCRNGLFAQQEGFAQARVSEPRRTFFYEDMDGCPTRAGALDACRSNSYVIEGDMLVIGRSLGDFVCAFFPNDVGDFVGKAAAIATIRWAAARLKLPLLSTLGAELWGGHALRRGKFL